MYLSFYISMQLYVFLTIQMPPELLKTNEDIMKSGRTPILNPIRKNITFDSRYIKYSEFFLECGDVIDCQDKVLLHKGMT